MTFEYCPGWPHGELEEVLTDIFFVTGSNRTHHAGVDLQTSRAMVAARQDDGLTLAEVTGELQRHAVERGECVDRRRDRIADVIIDDTDRAIAESSATPSLRRARTER